MRYIGGHTREEGCIFCNRLDADRDIASLILHRGPNTFVIMNLYPYNTGHVMLVPNTHVADPADLSPETLREMGETLPFITSALRRVLGCDGFNVGLNIGEIAGAGVAEHLHQHIVPRWTGDANFMPILASTMVLPELIPVTYAKIRAELERENRRLTEANLVVLDERDRALLLHGRVPEIPLHPDVPVWKTLVAAIPSEVPVFELAGWSGANSTRGVINIPIGLTFRAVADAALPAGWDWVGAEDENLAESTRSLIQRAILQLAPAI
ncbi:MAG TPA: HIT domain-containing protein [Thermomicrobiales bacterium]|nr:HIT domain-containing protein [Thermomicrobiales bacterium]